MNISPDHSFASRVRRCARPIVFLALLFVVTTAVATHAALAQTAPPPQAQPEADAANIEERARAIGRELRCVVCQNQSIDDSNAPLALDLKQLLRERLHSGDSDAEAKAFLVARYGNFVLLKPPFQFNTVLLWLGPFLLFGLVGWLVRRYFATPRELPLQVPELSSDDLKTIDAILEKGSRP